MTGLLRRLRRDERGMSYVFVGLGFFAFLSATTLAIDVGMLMTARSQAQNAADAGALAAAIALGFDNYNDRSSTGPAVQNAITAARQGANEVMSTPVSITPADVVFLNDPNGLPNWVQVDVYRTSSTGNPVSTLIAGLFGTPTADIRARATAEVAKANAETCVKPFTLPDKWIEKQTPPWDPDDTFDAFDNQGKPLANPDIYIPTSPTQVGTGYDPAVDVGLPLMIRAGTGNNITPSFYFSLALPSDTGASDYEWNIANCNTSIIHPGYLMIQEPGNMVGPTIHGAEALIAKDPNAQWDSANNRVINSNASPSPRVFPIPLYDPVYYDEGKRNGRNADLKATNFLGFFIESVQGNNIYGRVTPVGGIIDGGGPSPLGFFPIAIRLVQ